MKRKILIIVLLSIWITYGGNAQQTSVPPSSEMSLSGQWAGSPGGLHTGTLNIDVPLWVLKGKKLTAPVSLSYNATGIRAGQGKGLTGLGWNLNAGGAISRTVRGIPDEAENGWLQRAGDVTSDIVGIRDSLVKGLIDDMPDLYVFSCPGISGKFVYDGNGIITLTPYQPLDITFDSANDEFTIVTQGGTKYIFGGSLNSVVNNIVTYTDNQVNMVESSPPGSLIQEATLIRTRTLNYNSEWHIRQIITADASDVITFDYYEQWEKSDYYTDNTFLVPEQNHSILEAYLAIPVSYETIIKNKYSFVLPFSITGQNSKVRFYYDNNYKELEKIQVSNLNNEVKKTYSFFYAEDKLVSITDENSPQPPYYFEYDNRYTTGDRVDYWGFYTDSLNKYPSEDCFAGILTRINYPSGGYQLFEYGLHQEDTIIVGGARIEKVTSSGFVNMPDNVKKYSYYNMRYMEPADTAYIINYKWDIENYPPMSMICYRSFYKYPYGNGEGSHVSYGIVSVYEGEEGENGLTKYYFTNDGNAMQSIPDVQYPYAPATNMEWKRGLLYKTEMYKKSNGLYKLVSRKENTYWQDPDHNKSIFSRKVGYINYPAEVSSDFIWASTQIVSSRMMLTESKNFSYDDNGNNPVSHTTRYFYCSDGDLLRRSEQHIAAENKLLVTHYIYPEDYSSGFPADMLNIGLKSVPVETVTYMYENYTEGDPLETDSLQVLSASINVYDANGNMTELWSLELPEGKPLPMASFRFSNQQYEGLPSTINSTFSLDSRYYDQKTTFDRYVEGNLVQYTSNEMSHCVIYGYNHTIAVAKIDNATYSEIEQALGNDLALINGNTLDDAALRQKISNLRSLLPDAYISSSTYQPVLGLKTSSTDANNRNSFVEYDEFNRVKLIKDKDGNIISKNSYDENFFRLILTNTTYNSLSFDITPPGDMDVSEYKVYYRKETLSPYYEQEIVISQGNQLTISNLEPVTNYVVYVEAHSGSSKIAYSAPEIFITDNEASPPPPPPDPPASLSVSPDNTQNIGYTAPPRDFDVSCNKTWTVSADVDWINFSVTTGTGNGQFTVTYNSSPLVHATRTGTFTVTCENENVTITVNQAGQPCPEGSHWEEGTGCVWD